LIIDVPPKLRGSEKENFVSKDQKRDSFVKNPPCPFISSTSVYGDTSFSTAAGDDTFSVTEETNRILASESGRQLVQQNNFLAK
jgi:hypothetical protein